MADEKLYTTQEVADLVGVSSRTIQLWAASGVVKAWKTPGGHRRFPEAEVARLQRDLGSDTSSGRQTILVVEDEESVRSLAVLALTRLGYQVLEAENGIEGLEIIEKHSGKIPLVMTDVVMPQMGGPELAEKIIQRYPEIRLVFISGYTDQEIISRRINGKKIDFIQKPFSLNEFSRKIRTILDKRIR